MKPIISLSKARALQRETSMCLTVPTAVARLDITNMQIKKEDHLGIIHFQFLKALSHTQRGTPADLHGLFGVGISLSRIVVQELLSKDLVQRVNGVSSAWWITNKGPSTTALLFHQEEDKKCIPNPLDKVVIELTEEGKKVVESGRYTPITILPHWTGFFTVPPLRFVSSSIMASLLEQSAGKPLTESVWKEGKTDIDAQMFFSTTAEGGLREFVGVPEDNKGPLLEDKEDPETGYITPKSTITWKELKEPLPLPITYLVKGVLHENPTIMGGYLPSPSSHKEPNQLTGKTPTFKEILSEEYVPTFQRLFENSLYWTQQFSSDDQITGGIMYGDAILVNERTQHLFLVMSPSLKIDDMMSLRESSDIQIFSLPSKRGVLELEFRIVPGSTHIAQNWLIKKIDQISFPRELSLDKNTLRTKLKEVLDNMKEVWVVSKHPHIQALKPPSVDVFIERRWNNGNWHLIYQLSFQEDFPDA